MSKRMTVADLAAVVEAQNAQIAALLADIRGMTTPVASTPATGKVSAAFGNRTFDAYVADRRASAIPCEIHAAGTCNRAFSPKSSGRTGHVARIV
jgi:hypothetical protein